MTLRDYIRVFRRRWLIILACVLVAAGVTFAVADDGTKRAPTGYSATATLLAGSTSQTTGSNLSRVALFITTGDIPTRAAKALGYTGEPAVLASQLAVTPDSAAGAITITAKDNQGERAATIANTFADETVRYFADGKLGSTVSILQRATPIAETPSGGFIVPPGRLPRSLIAAALGLLLGAALALIVDHLDSRLRSRDQVHKALRMPVIAEVPKLKNVSNTGGKLRVVEEPLGPFADAYRSARTAITHLPALQVEGSGTTPPRRQSGAEVVLVTSGFVGEGKTTSVANLAASFAETGKSVLVVDGDLRKPNTHVLLDVPQGAGVTDHLLDPYGVPLEAIVRPTAVPGVQMITAGTRLESPTSLVTRMGLLIDELRSEADVIVVDSSPLLAASGVYDLLPLVDAVLLVVRSGRLTDAAGARIAEVLGRYHTPVIGAMLIGAPAGSNGYGYGYGYGYGRGYGYGAKKATVPAPVTAAQGAAHPDSILTEDGPGATVVDLPQRARSN